MEGPGFPKDVQQSIFSWAMVYGRTGLMVTNPHEVGIQIL